MLPSNVLLGLLAAVTAVSAAPRPGPPRPVAPRRRFIPEIRLTPRQDPVDVPRQSASPSPAAPSAPVTPTPPEVPSQESTPVAIPPAGPSSAPPEQVTQISSEPIAPPPSSTTIPPEVVPVSTATTSSITPAPIPSDVTPAESPGWGTCIGDCYQVWDASAGSCHLSDQACYKELCSGSFTRYISVCAECVKTGQGVSQDRRDQMTGLLATCNNFLDPKPYGNCDMCEAAISNLTPYCNNNESGECKGACKPELLDPLMQCASCIGQSPTANQEDKTQVSEWVKAMEATCATLELVCDKECAISPKLQEQCGLSGAGLYPSSCPDMCSDFNSAQTCFDCRKAGPTGVPEDLAWSFTSIEFWCSPGGCWSTCMGAADLINKNCADEGTCRTNMCSGDNKGRVDSCYSCMHNAPIDTPTRNSIVTPIQTVREFCITEPPDCDQPCGAILKVNDEVCSGGDPVKCAVMCAPTNLDALGQCNACLEKSKHASYDGDFKIQVRNNLDSLRDWCEVPSTSSTSTASTPGVSPSVNPKGPSTVVTVTWTAPNGEVSVTPVVINARPPPTPVPPRGGVNGTASRSGIIVPTGKPASSNNNANSSGSGSSKGIPTWGIGVASAGGVAVVVAAASAVVAYNFECDHDHRRLRRKKKSKKKKDDNMPPPELHPEPETSQLIGYVYPTTSHGQGYDPGPASPPMSTPLSAPVSIAHMPMGPPPMTSHTPPPTTHSPTALSQYGHQPNYEPQQAFGQHGGYGQQAPWAQQASFSHPGHPYLAPHHGGQQY